MGSTYLWASSWTNQVQPPFMGQNSPNYQQFGGFYGKPQQTFGPTGVALPYQYYNYPQPN